EDGELLRRRREVVTQEAQQRRRALGRMEDQPAEHLRSGLVEAEFEGCHNAEVAAATTDPPEEILVLDSRGMYEASVRGHHVGASQVVGGKAESACEVSESAAHSESGHPGGGHYPTRHRQPKSLCLVVDIAPNAAGINGGAPAGWIHTNRPHPRQVDDQPVVAGGVAGDGVAPAADRREQVVPTAELYCGDYIRGSRAAGHHCRAAPDGAVPDGCRGLITVVIRGDNRPPEARAE